MSNSCEECKFWSERIAESIGGGPIKALCLNGKSHRYGQMVCKGCSEYLNGRPIDDPAMCGHEGDAQ